MLDHWALDLVRPEKRQASAADGPPRRRMTLHGDSPKWAGGGDCLEPVRGVRSARRISHPAPPDHYRDVLSLVFDKVGIDRHYCYYYISTA